MRSTTVRILFTAGLAAILFGGCANANKGFRTVGKVFSPVTGAVKGAAKGLAGTGSEMANDVGGLTTKIPGTTRTNLTPRERQAIADYERKKRYDQWVQKYNVDSSLIPKNAKVHISK